MYSVLGIFQHHFQCKKVRTILDKILFQKSWILSCQLKFCPRLCRLVQNELAYCRFGKIFKFWTKFNNEIQSSQVKLSQGKWSEVERSSIFRIDFSKVSRRLTDAFDSVKRPGRTVGHTKKCTKAPPSPGVGSQGTAVCGKSDLEQTWRILIKGAYWGGTIKTQT